MYSKTIEESKKKLKLTKRQRDIVSGLMLGDGCLETQNNKTTFRLKVEQSLIHKEYVDWLYGELKPFVRTEPKVKIKRLGKKVHKNYGFQTLSCVNFRFFAHQFYTDDYRSKKISEIVRRFLTPLSLAVWFMDDGQRKSKRHRTLLLNTQCFSKRELRILQKALKEKFSIITTFQKEKNGWRMYLVSSTLPIFLELITPYILPSMAYKTGINIHA